MVVVFAFLFSKTATEMVGEFEMVDWEGCKLSIVIVCEGDAIRFCNVDSAKTDVMVEQVKIATIRGITVSFLTRNFLT